MKRINFIDIENRKDFLSVDKLTAISAEGEVLTVGDKVEHEANFGTKIKEYAFINKFILNEETMDIIALTSKGEARICFISKVEQKEIIKDYLLQEQINKIEFADAIILEAAFNDLDIDLENDDIEHQLGTVWVGKNIFIQLMRCENDDDDLNDDDDDLSEYGGEDPEERFWKDKATFDERFSGQDDDDGDQN